MENQFVKHGALLVVGLFLSVASFGQISFYKVYSGNGYDKGEGIAQLPDSGFLVTGSSSSFGDAPSQVFLMRLDSMGAFQWSKAYGGIEFEEGKLSLEDLRTYAVENGEPKTTSGRQEYLENIIKTK